MILTTTDTIEGRPVREYLGIVTGEAIMGANIFKDFFAGVRDVIGGRSGSYEGVLREIKDEALKELGERAAALGADAVLSIDLDYEVIGGDAKTMLMLSVNGTAVRLER